MSLVKAELGPLVRPKLGLFVRSVAKLLVGVAMVLANVKLLRGGGKLLLAQSVKLAEALLLAGVELLLVGEKLMLPVKVGLLQMAEVDPVVIVPRPRRAWSGPPRTSPRRSPR